MLTALIVLLILALLFGGLGFVAHVLWYVAVILLIIWLVGLLTGRRRSWF